MKQVTHRVDEDLAWLSPPVRNRQRLTILAHDSIPDGAPTSFSGQPRIFLDAHRFQTSGHLHRVAMGAPSGDNRTSRTGFQVASVHSIWVSAILPSRGFFISRGIRLPRAWGLRTEPRRIPSHCPSPPCNRSRQRRRRRSCRDRSLACRRPCPPPLAAPR